MARVSACKSLLPPTSELIAYMELALRPMHAPKPPTLLWLSLSLSVLAGCAGLDANRREPLPECVNTTPPRTDFDELFAFQTGMAEIPAASRTEICRALLQSQKQSPDVMVQLKLIAGRVLSDSCGDLPKTLEAIANLPPEKLADERLRRFVAVNKETLAHMLELSKKLGSLERKQKKLRNVVDNKDASAIPKNDDSTSTLLREKLDAIRSMEKQLDETGETK